MNRDIKISVIVPVYNVEKYIRQCLESIVNQTYKNLEIIVVNDGTKDNSMQIVEEFLSDSRLKVINKENGGISSARNRGIEEATGDYISFVDSDDWIDINLYENIVYKINKNEEIIIFNYGIYKEKLNSLEYKLLDFEKLRKLPVELLFRNINGECWNKIYRLDFLKNNNLRFPEGLIYEDIFWEIDTLHKVKDVGLLDFNGYIYRADREGSIVNSIGLEKAKESCKKIILKIENFEESNREKLSTIQQYRLKLFQIYIRTFLEEKLEFKSIEKDLEKIKIFKKNERELFILKSDIQKILKRKTIRNINFSKLIFWKEEIYTIKIFRRALKIKIKSFFR